jgi:hypothetical protein
MNKKNDKMIVIETSAGGKKFKGTYVMPESDFRHGLDQALTRLKEIAPSATANIQKQLGADGVIERPLAEVANVAHKTTYFTEEHSDGSDDVYDGWASIRISPAEMI